MFRVRYANMKGQLAFRKQTVLLCVGSKNAVFWDMTTWDSSKNRRSLGTYRLRLQGDSVSHLED
jgi:hypothetical protein